MALVKYKATEVLELARRILAIGDEITKIHTDMLTKGPNEIDLHPVKALKAIEWLEEWKSKCRSDFERQHGRMMAKRLRDKK